MTFLNAIRPELMDVVLGVLLIGVVLALMTAAHVWRDAVHRQRTRMRRPERGDVQRTHSAANGKVEEAVSMEAHLEEYLANAASTYEGNPHFGWMQRYF